MDELNKKETLKKKHKHQQMNEADINHVCKVLNSVCKSNSIVSLH